MNKTNMTAISNLDTPCLLVDKQVLIKNINRIQNIANKLDIKLRPHVKTHKSTYIYNLQKQAGAVGITASKPKETIPFIEAGVSSVKLVYPLVDKQKLSRFLDYVKNNHPNTEIIVCIDSVVGLEAVKHATLKTSLNILVQIIINVGYDRCGLDPFDTEILSLVEKINRSEFLQFHGLATHNGLTYGAKNKKQIAKLNETEIKQLLKVQKRLANKGVDVLEISAGSTPGVLGNTTTLTGVDEIRPGNYVFMDRTPYELGLIKKRQVALSVLSQIISENNKYYIIDAGKKVLSSDRRKGVDDFGLVYPWNKFGKRKNELKLVRLSEEHGFIKKENHMQYSIGDKVRILPNHSCVVANLANEFCMVEKDIYLQAIPIEAAKSSHGDQND